MNEASYNIYPIRASAVLTNGYVAGTVLGPTNGNVSKNSQLIIYAGFTIGSLTDTIIKVEFSHDGTTYYQETFDGSPSSGVITEALGTRKLTATGNYRISIPIKDNYIKISAIGTGTVTDSLLVLNAVLGTE